MTSNDHIPFRNDKSHGDSELRSTIIPIDALVDIGDCARNVTQYSPHPAANLPHLSQHTSDSSDYWGLHADTRLFPHALSPPIDAEHSDFSSFPQLLSPLQRDSVLNPGTMLEMCMSINGDAYERQSSSSNSGSACSGISPLLNTSPWSLSHPMSPIDPSFQLYFEENISSEAIRDGELYNPFTNDKKVEHEGTLLQGGPMPPPPLQPLSSLITAAPSEHNHIHDIQHILKQQYNPFNSEEVFQEGGTTASRGVRIASPIAGKKRKKTCPDIGLVSTVATAGNSNGNVECNSDHEDGNGRGGSNKNLVQHNSKRSRLITPRVADQRDEVELTIIQGIKKATSAKQPGGKGNKKALPRFVIETNISKYSKSNSIVQLALKEQLAIEALLIGNKDGVETELDTIASTFVRIDKGEAATATKFTTSFASLVVKFASHSYGKRLFVRFCLMDKECNVSLGQVDSGTFETITKRGIEKQRKKEYVDTVPAMTAKLTPRIDSIEPSVGCLHGSQLVKIVGSFRVRNAMDVSVVFGDRESLNIYCVKRDCIICETPVFDKLGNFEVRISLDGKKTFVKNARQCVMFQVVDANREEGRLLVVQQLMTKSAF